MVGYSTSVLVAALAIVGANAHIGTGCGGHGVMKRNEGGPLKSYRPRAPTDEASAAMSVGKSCFLHEHLFHLLVSIPMCSRLFLFSLPRSFLLALSIPFVLVPPVTSPSFTFHLTRRPHRRMHTLLVPKSPRYQKRIPRDLEHSNPYA
jgi:hypothetical protein